MSFFGLILSVVLILLNFQTVFPIEIIFDRVELINGTYVDGIYNASLCRVTKTSRTTYAVNLDIVQFIDFDENAEVTAIFYYNRFNNNQYNLSPMRVKRSKICETWKYYSKLVFTPENNHTSNMADPNVFCPFKKVFFHFFKQ